MGDQLDGRQSKSSLVKLEQLVEEIPSGVSREDVGRILEIETLEETTNFITNRITKTLKSALEDFWETYQIEERLANRHLTERYDIDEFKLKYFQRKKQFLEEIINKNKQELDEYHDDLKKNVEDIRRFEAIMKGV